MHMKMSVIIPTYNRATMLGFALDALAKQEYSKQDYEIIVVDNNSRDNTPAMVQAFQAKNPEMPIHYVFEPCPGLVHARHAGARASHFEILCFTDDDGIWAPTCLRAIADVFARNPKVAAVGGKIVVRWDQPPPRWVIPYEPLLGKLDYGDEVRIATGLSINGGNFSIRKSVLFDLGGFNPDQIGDWLIGDGETGLCHKLHKAGALVGWAPQALMEHCQSVEKNATMQDIKRRFINNGRGVPYKIYSTDNKGAAALSLNLAKAFIKILYWNCYYIKYFVLGNDAERRLALFQRAFFTCQFPYTLKIMLSQEFRKMLRRRDWLSR